MKYIYSIFIILFAFTLEIQAHEGKETYVLKEVAKIHLSIFEEKSGILDTKSLIANLRSEADHKKNTEYFKKALPIAEELGKTNDLAKKRELFEALSNQLEPILGHHDKSGVSLFYCPMLKKKWLAFGKNIRNPYDPKMKDCGEIRYEAK
ncbi:LIC13259/LIC11441 family protein [Leptospira sarikeiensis]|uniref:DUF3347 domain-containing protein n=1 Tax=Leptospira sarikeiensis TaxID=2484943 RepID=A0A4R9K3G8_9LEPT|nr:DUF3347 domain-containing protein [Leptospira sarikeiensis]TGL59450.1 DUF3347 domain-containing protein [Leptospira sarikeiensis]